MKLTHPFFVLTVAGGLLIATAWWWGNQRKETAKSAAYVNSSAETADGNDALPTGGAELPNVPLHSAPAPQPSSIPPPKSPERSAPTEESWETKVKSLIAERLKDPDSAKFRELKRLAQDQACGQVNAKNAFGGYVGYRWFWVSRLDEQAPAVLIDTDQGLAEIVCTGAAS